MPARETFEDYLTSGNITYFLSKVSDGSQQFYCRNAGNAKRRVVADDIKGLGLTLINKALYRGKSAALIQAIIALSTEGLLLDTNSQGETPLYLATKLQRYDVVDLLLNSSLMTPKIFFKPNFVTAKSVLQLAKEKKSESLKPHHPEHASDIATNILMALYAKESELSDMRLRDVPTQFRATLRDTLSELDKKLQHLRDSHHNVAATALSLLVSTLRELDYDTKGAHEDPNFKARYKTAILTLYRNAPAMAEINEQRGAKRAITWAVSKFYDVNDPKNRHSFFTPQTNTSQLLDVVKDLTCDDELKSLTV